MRILITGASGALGSYLCERLVAAGHEPVAWSGRETGTRAGMPLRPVELTDHAEVDATLADADPAAIVHLAAISAADAVRRDPARAEAVNVAATAHLADWCARHDRKLVFTSTDLVFDGSRPWNREDDPALPVLAYGRTKLAAERPVLAAPGGLVARVSLLYGFSRSGRPAFFDRAVDELRMMHPQTFFEDEYRTPLDLATAAEILGRLAVSDVSNVIHVGGIERVSRFTLMQRAATALGLDPSLVRPNRRADADLPEPRPADVSLETERLAGLFPDLRRPTIEEAFP